MKNWIVLLALNMVVGLGFAQQLEQPKEGAQIYLSNYQVDVDSNDEVKLDLWIVSSKKAKKSKFDTPKFLGAQDLNITVEADPNEKDHFIATVKTDGVSNGTYFYTVSSRSRSIQKVKGTTVTFNVGNVKALTKNNR